jgi:hypothetical protein
MVSGKSQVHLSFESNWLPMISFADPMKINFQFKHFRFCSWYAFALTVLQSLAKCKHIEL